MTANWSSRMSHFTVGNCLVNSSASLLGSGNPVSKYPLRVTGALPQEVATTAELLVEPALSESLPGALHPAVTTTPSTATKLRLIISADMSYLPGLGAAQPASAPSKGPRRVRHAGSAVERCRVTSTKPHRIRSVNRFSRSTFLAPAAAGWRRGQVVDRSIKRT